MKIIYVMLLGCLCVQFLNFGKAEDLKKQVNKMAQEADIAAQKDLSNVVAVFSFFFGGLMGITGSMMMAEALLNPNMGGLCKGLTWSGLGAFLMSVPWIVLKAEDEHAQLDEDGVLQAQIQDQIAQTQSKLVCLLELYEQSKNKE